MPFVEYLHLKEFRGVRETVDPIRLSKFNVLIGRNNSAKSTLLYALSLLPYPEVAQPLLYTGPPLGGTNTKLALLNHLTGYYKPYLSLIYGYSGEAQLEFGFRLEDREARRYQILINEGGVRAHKFTPSDQTEPVTRGWEEACEYLHITPAGTKPLSGWALLIPNDSEFLSKVKQTLLDQWDPLEKKGVHYTVVREVINPAIDEKFTEVTKRNGGMRARKEVNGVPSWVRIEDLGDGVEKVITVLLFVELWSPKLLLWDDFEVSAHPSLLREVIRWLNRRDWQVVLATHSIDVLYELTEVRPEGLQVIQLKKTPDDRLLHRSLGLKELEDFISGGSDPRLLVDAIR